MAKELNRSKDSVKRKLSRLGLFVDEDTRKERQRQANANKDPQYGENNPNWKGGISKNYYHYKKIQMERYPEKIRAREIVYNAVRSGKLHRQPCSVCGEQDTEAHHEDYRKPLDVVWLCRKHHRELHRNSEST